MAQSRQGAGNLRVIIRVGQEKCGSCLFITFSGLLWSVTPFSLGTQSSFRRLYEEPIVRGQQPDASSEEKLLGQTRAAEVINSDEKLISSYWIDS